MLTKQSILILSAIGISFAVSPLFAAKATVGSRPAGVAVSAPCLQPGFSYTIGASALMPGASNLNYAIYNNELPAQTPTWKEQEIQPNFATAFNVGIRYVFPYAAGVDANLDWTHLINSTTSNTISVPNAAWFIGPDFEIGPAALPIQNAHGRAKFDYDAINLDVGQYLRFGQQVDLRFFGGLSTAFLREQVNTYFTGEATGVFAGPFSTQQNVTSNFAGMGPRLGIHADVFTCSGFSFLGEAAASALFGAQHSKTAYLSSAPELLALFGQTSNYQTIKDDRVFQVIPALDAKLGVNYAYQMNNMLFNVSAGYQAAVYINAISQYIPGSLVDGAPMDSGGIFVATMAHTLSNYSVQGPFLNVTFSC